MNWMNIGKKNKSKYSVKSNTSNFTVKLPCCYLFKLVLSFVLFRTHPALC